MRPKTLPRRGSRPRSPRGSLPRAVRPRVELLESRVVPSNIDYSMGFANHSGLTATGSASFPMIGGTTVAQLTDGGANETGSILTNDTFGTSQFNTDFTFAQTSTTAPTGGELDFIFQGGGNKIGIYFALDLQGLPMSLTGVTTNGQATSRVDVSGYGINLHSQDPMHVSAAYDGTTLSWTIQDTVTNAVTPHITLSVNIPSLVGNAANVGFIGMTDTNGAVQYVKTWTGTFNAVVPPTTPTLTSLSSTTAVEGSSDVTLTLNGSNFVSNTTAQWNGTNLTTTFVNANQLTAVVPASLLTEEGNASVTVSTPSVGTSAAQTFTVVDAPLTGIGITFNPTAGTSFTGQVATFSDANVNAPTSDFTATINWGNGTTSAGTITSLGGGKFSVGGTNTYAQSGTFPVSVAIADDGGAMTTAASTANVGAVPSAPTLTSLSPTTAVEGSSDLTLTVSGANFASNSIVQWNGANLTTSFVSGSQLTAVVPANFLAEEGNSLVTVSTPGVGTSAALTLTVIDAPLTGTSVTVNATAGTALTLPVASFSDANTNAPTSDFQATINWGNGTTSAGTIVSQGSGNFLVLGTNTYDQAGTYPVVVTITDSGGASTTVTSTANVASGTTSPALTSISPSIAVEGSSDLTLTVSGSNFASNSTVQWNGTELTTAFVNANQLAALVPANLLAEEGNASVTVSTPGVGSSAPQTFTIVDAPLTGGTVVLTTTAGASFTGPVATFSDANVNAPVSDFTAIIDWGNGSTSTGTISSQGGGVFSVSGTNTYAQSGTSPVSVLITDIGGATTTVTGTANVLGTSPTFTLAGVNFNATEGVAFSDVVVATLTDTNSNATPANYSVVTIAWGDGQQSSGTVVVNPNGGFEILGSHTYAEEGNYTVQVFVADTSGAAATASGTAQVADAPLTPTSVPISPTAGNTFTGVVATFTDANSTPDINDFSATINWGDGNVSAGTITQNSDGTFSVSGTNTYQTAGAYTVLVTITDVGGATAAAATTINVTTGAQPLVATGIDFSGTAGVSQDFTVATFTDVDPNAQTGSYAVAINWGDGTPIDPGTVTQPGGKGTPFFVDYSHAYSQPGTYTVQVQIFKEAGAYATASSTATIGSAARARAPGNSGPGSLGTDLFVAVNGVQVSAAPQQHGGTITTSSGAASTTPLLTSSAPLQAGSSKTSDLYWQFLYGWHEDRITDPNGWAAHELTLALEGT